MKKRKQENQNAGRSNSEKKSQRNVTDRNKLVGINENSERGGAGD
jgi:hypothetical protein